ncbi:uncharacterized protein LOC131970674 [Centropristis striata]|uniref:uncharacterized protein LOC131970674 n=1 Tax=Centropristis striata TaxID=184440 RepID=UPI0027DF43B1|nr:uncharacterized protein LOC131970674 [Centropristis striata]
MAFPLSASMLLTSRILLLYWWTSSAGSHDLSPPYRVKRDLPFETRPQVEQSLSVAKDVLGYINKKIKNVDSNKVKNVMKGLSTIAGLVPGIGTLVAPVLNTILVFIPQDDPVLNEVKKGFAEVNKKLDSLSIQISNLATDVEWFNYVSVYSQDEVRILNAWKKFNELQDNSHLVKSEEDKLRLAEIFVNYYENTGTEGSVDSLFHYLTVTNTSLSGNINDLLKKKFKCDVQKIGNYNIHFSTLLWRGMVLNQFYWKLIGFDLLDKETEHTEMMKEVYTAQISTIDHCLDNYTQYMKKDVEEISKALSHANKTVVADEVKKALDEKFYWYSWVVLVYSTNEDTSNDLYNMIKIPAGAITVAVGYTQKAEEIHITQVSNMLELCYQRTVTGFGRASQIFRKPCDVIKEMRNCDQKVDGIPIREFVKVMHASHKNRFVHVPEPMKTFECDWSPLWVYSSYIYYSGNVSTCSNHTCETDEQCKELGDSNEHLCLCPDGYRRESCEEPEKHKEVQLIDKGRTVPDISTINAKLELILQKLNRPTQ